jgi:hypothetical protein
VGNGGVLLAVPLQAAVPAGAGGMSDDEGCEYAFCDGPGEHAHCLECGERIEWGEFLCDVCEGGGDP